MDLKMEVYSQSLELIGILEAWDYCILNRQAFGAGNFNIEANLTRENLSLLKEENIILLDRNNAGIIENQHTEARETGFFITAKGYDLTGILNRRIPWGLYDLTGTPAAIMRYLVYDSAIEPTRGDDIEARKIPRLVMSEDFVDSGAKIRKQVTGGNLLDVLSEIGLTYQVAFGVRLNPETMLMEFWTRQGVNRTINQTVNEPVFFSTDLDDINESEYTYDSRNYKNVALVAGEGEGLDRTYVVVKEEEATTPPTPEIPKYTVTVSVSPDGYGTATGGGTYQEGTQITLVATPAQGYEFVGWKANGVTVSNNERYTFTVGSDRALVAVFAAIIQTYRIQTAVDPDGGGTVTGAGYYKAGTTATLSAHAADGYEFVQWRETGVTDAVCTITVDGNQTFTAVFAEIAVSRLPDGYTEVECVKTGTSVVYLSTGLTPEQFTAIELGIKASAFSSGNNNNQYLLYANNYFRVWRPAASRIAGMFNSSATSSINRDFPTSKGTVKYDKIAKKFYINALSYDVTVGASGTASNLNLFGYSGYDPVPCELYGCKMWNDDVLVRDFIPCINPSGKVGLYDVVNGAFYAPTGSFTAGPAV